MKTVVNVRLPSGTIVSVSEPNNSANNYVGPYGAGVSLTDKVSKPVKSDNHIGPYGDGVDQNDR